MVPIDCRGCKHRYNDVEEGHNCRKYDKKIKLSNGSILKWHGWAVEEAHKECMGEGKEITFGGKFRWFIGL